MFSCHSTEHTVRWASRATPALLHSAQIAVIAGQALLYFLPGSGNARYYVDLSYRCSIAPLFCVPAAIHGAPPLPAPVLGCTPPVPCRASLRQGLVGFPE